MKPLLPHPIAMEFPEIDADTFQDLMVSMKKSGFDANHPIVVYEGKILDGRNRYRAVTEINRHNKGSAPIVPTFRDFTGTRDEAIEFSIRENLHRRHLTAGQKALIAEGMAHLNPGRPEINSANLQSIQAVAAKVHVAPRTVQSARELRKLDPAAANRVKEGKETLNKALTTARKEQAVRETPPPKPKAMLDGEGREIHPAAMKSLSEGAARFAKARNTLLALGREVKDMATTPDGRMLRWEEIKTDLDNIARALRYSAPYTSCPLNDPCDDDCKLCKGTQWITESQWTGVPREYKGDRK